MSRVLVACEFSGIVRDAFIAAASEAEGPPDTELVELLRRLDAASHPGPTMRWAAAVIRNLVNNPAPATGPQVPAESLDAAEWDSIAADPGVPTSPVSAVPAVDEWAETMMDALLASDGGDNPFYSDDDDTISLARQLAEAVVGRLRR